MTWRLLTFCAFLSTALLLVIVIMWIGSYSVALMPVGRIPGTHTWIRLTHQHGTLTTAWLPDRPPARPAFTDFPDAPADILGFSFRRATIGGIASAPYWLFALAFAIAPALWYWTARRKFRRAAAGLCPRCGYDLRATPTRCPECGAMPAEM